MVGGWGDVWRTLRNASCPYSPAITLSRASSQQPNRCGVLAVRGCVAEGDSTPASHSPTSLLHPSCSSMLLYAAGMLGARAAGSHSPPSMPHGGLPVTGRAGCWLLLRLPAAAPLLLLPPAAARLLPVAPLDIAAAREQS